MEITRLPYQLNSDTPPEGVSLAEYFGVPTERLAAISEGPKRRAEALGLVFNPPDRIVNTGRAHQLAEYARDAGKHAALHRLLFEAHFVHGRDLNSDDVLADLARRAGFDHQDALARVQAGEYQKRLLEARELAQEMGITGVPTFVVNRRYRIVGAHPYEALRDALLQIESGEGA